MKTENVDKIIQSIKDSVVVSKDVQKDMEDGKISLVEGSMLVIKHGGKAVRLVVSAKEIWDELKDLDEAEAEQVMEEIAAGYGQGNPEAMAHAKDIIAGLARIRKGIVGLIEMNQSEEEVKE